MLGALTFEAVTGRRDTSSRMGKYLLMESTSHASLSRATRRSFTTTSTFDSRNFFSYSMPEF